MNTHQFQQLIYGYFREHPRSLPWRSTTDPYGIMVSEVMLQQTQVERVLPRYAAFLDRFPTVETLAAAPLADLLALWQGLGYNRRAMMLKRAAEEIMARHGGAVPHDPADLSRLSGIGAYTAGAIAAFAFGHATPFIETNIRSVFIHVFFHDRTDVRDSEIMSLIEGTMDRHNIRDWYNALMDYGAMLKQRWANPNKRSAHYSRQGPFENSDRQVRGRILKVLVNGSPLSAVRIAHATGMDAERVKKNLAALEKEGFIERRGRRYLISA